jgi:hypothetical protein
MSYIEEHNQALRHNEASLRHDELQQKYAGISEWTEEDWAEMDRRIDEADKANGYSYDCRNAIYLDYFYA